MGLPNPSRETKFSGTNRDGRILVISLFIQLTTSGIGNLTRLILTLATVYMKSIRYIQGRLEREGKHLTWSQRLTVLCPPQ